MSLYDNVPSKKDEGGGLISVKPQPTGKPMAPRSLAVKATNSSALVMMILSNVAAIPAAFSTALY